MGSLPDVIVIGAMKCGTSALHAHLDKHPDIAMAAGKELNFFFGGEQPPAAEPSEWWQHGQWHRGLAWYRTQFDDSAAVRGEASPGYTAPGRPEVAPRIRAAVPDVRLVYLVRDPVDRAVSQWQHHTRDDAEPRPLADALLDPDSQYVARSRYVERVAPFLAEFPREQLLVVVQERLARHPREVLPRVFEHVGADPGFWDDAMAGRVHAGGDATPVTDELRGRFWERVGDDVRALRELVDDDLPEWRDPHTR